MHIQDRDEAVSLVSKLEPRGPRGLVGRKRLHQPALRTERAPGESPVDRGPVRSHQLSQSVLETTRNEDWKSAILRESPQIYRISPDDISFVQTLLEVPILKHEVEFQAPDVGEIGA
jgi:hypothetical protein